jgi:hypothetical protein
VLTGRPGQVTPVLAEPMPVTGIGHRIFRGKADTAEGLLLAAG